MNNHSSWKLAEVYIPVFIFHIISPGTSTSYYTVAITVAARSKAWTVFARSKAGIAGSNTIQGMDVCVHLFYV
jgi:hypothetical protein